MAVLVCLRLISTAEFFGLYVNVVNSCGYKNCEGVVTHLQTAQRYGGVFQMISQPSSRKLVGRGTSGDFVAKSQTMAADEGFSKVSARWYKTTKSIEEEIEHLRSTRDERETVYTKLGRLTPTRVDGRFGFHIEGGRDVFPDKYSIGQIGSLSGVGPYYPRKLLDLEDDDSAEMLELVFDHARRKMDVEKPCMLKVQHNEELRAVLPASDCHLRGEWYLGVLQRGIPGARLSHWRGDEYTIYGNLLIPDTIRQESDSEYGGMISLSNCELGTRKFRQRPSLFRAICQNGCVHNEARGRTFKLKRLGVIELADLEKLLIEDIHEQIPLIQTDLEKFLGTRSFETKVPMKAVFAELCRTRRLSRDQGSSILRAYHQEKTDVPELAKTLFSVINSVTRAGQEHPNDVWVRFDEIGGDLSRMKRDDWDQWVARAAKLKSEDVHRAFTPWSQTSPPSVAG